MKRTQFYSFQIFWWKKVSQMQPFERLYRCLYISGIVLCPHYHLSQEAAVIPVLKTSISKFYGRLVLLLGQNEGQDDFFWTQNTDIYKTNLSLSRNEPLSVHRQFFFYLVKMLCHWVKLFCPCRKTGFQKQGSL